MTLLGSLRLLLAPTFSIEGAEGSVAVARQMSSEGVQTVCDPNRIRLTGAAAFVVIRLRAFVFLSDGDYCIICLQWTGCRPS